MKYLPQAMVLVFALAVAAQAGPFDSIGGFIQDPVGTTRKEAGRGSEKARGAVKSGGQAAQKTGRNLGNTARGAGNQLGNTARSAGNSIGRETARGIQSGGRAIQQGGQRLRSDVVREYNSARSGAAKQGQNLGNLYNQGRNTVGRIGTPNLNPGGFNPRQFQPSVPNFQNITRQPQRWGQMAEDNVRAIGRDIDRGTRAPRRDIENAGRATARGIQDTVRGGNPGAYVEKQVQRVTGGNGKPGLGASSVVPGAVANLPQNIINAPSGVVKISKQAAAPLDKALKDTEREARQAGGAIAAGTRQAAQDGAAGVVAVGHAVGRTSEDVFTRGTILVEDGIEQGGRAIADAGDAAQTILEEGGTILVQAVEEGEKLYEQGEELYEQGEQLIREGQEIYEEGERRYNQAKDAYDTLRHGDRGEILDMVEDTTGVEINSEARRVLEETDLVTGVEFAEDVTGVDMTNVKERAAQAQAIGDAMRSGELNQVTEAAGAKSNRDEIRANKEAGWDGTAWGNEIDHEEYVKMTTAVGASVVSGNAGPFMAYAQNWAAEQYKTLSESLIKEGKAELAEKLNEQMLIDALQGAMNGQPVELPIKGVKIDVGMATYNHRLEASAGIPEITSNGIEINQKSAGTSLPNTHQPYVRFKFEE